MRVDETFEQFWIGVTMIASALLVDSMDSHMRVCLGYGNTCFSDANILVQWYLLKNHDPND